MALLVGIIGGTGIADLLQDLPSRAFHLPNAAGVLRGKILDSDGVSILLISRHSAGHKTPPHKVNYKAIVTGLRDLGVKTCFSSAAVGSLDPELGPGSFVVCTDFIDDTPRFPTMFDDTVVHRDFTTPFGPPAVQALRDALQAKDVAFRASGVYVCSNGPRYETPHEIERFRNEGGTVVGMTAASEAILMREAGVEYGCLAVITNFASGISPVELSHQEVVDEMKKSGPFAVDVLLRAAKSVAK